jgi:hypothetical protein
MSLRPVLLIFFIILLLFAAAGATYIQPTTTTTTSPPVRMVTAPVKTTTAPPSGGIAISSSPSGATVIIDDVRKGTTPLTVRPLSAGTHTLVLTLDGYQDYGAPITIGTSLERKSYTLVPVTTATTATTAPVRVLPTFAVPPVRVPVQNLSAQYKFPRPVSILPITITVAGHTRTPRLSTISPYFAAQLAAPSGIAGPSDIFTNATSFIEVDSYNVYLPQSHLMSGAEMALDPVWGDGDTVYIATTDRFFNNTNFRWISAEKGVTGFYQVSRFPFDANASHWQNEYAPGLVSSGPVKDVHVDTDGFHYFSLNFAAIANHNPSDPPMYTGVAQLEETVPGKGRPMGAVRIPLTGIVIWTKKGAAGPITVPLPAGLGFLNAGEQTESELGNPNANMVLSSSAIPSRAVTATESAIANLPRTYYVRVVPMHSDGTGGVPTIPVTVTVVRPQPCPPQPPANTEQDILVRPPSGTVASFYMTSFVPDWIHTDQNGALVSRAHFVTVTSPPACTAPKATSSGMMGGQTMDQLNAQACAQYGGSQPGYHFYADPEESHWYDTVWDIITSLFSAWGQVLHAVSVAWNDIQNLAAEITARYLSTVVLLGLYHCEDHPECVDVIHTANSAALAAFGIPPTIPDVSDLEGMGADYMAKIAAEELGAGGVVDVAEDVYNNLPDDVKQSIKDKANDVGDSVTGALVSESGSAVSAAAGGNFYIPDPLFYQPHPAMAMVKVYNPNNAPTDPVEMSVRDSAGLFRQSQSYYIPSLAPHDSTVIPVILEEDYSKVYTKDCSASAYTSTCGDICVPCYWNLWYFALIDNSKNGGDTFSVAFSTKKNGYYTGGLTPSSSGTVLSSNTIITFDEQGKSCGAYNAKTVLTYPSGWKMEQNGLNQDLWNLCWLKYSFTEGDHGRLIGG